MYCECGSLCIILVWRFWIESIWKTSLFVNKCFIRDEVNVTGLCDDFQYGRRGNVCCLWLVSVGWSEDEATVSRRSKTAGVWWCGKALIFVQQALNLPSRVTLPRKEVAVFFLGDVGTPSSLGQWKTMPAERFAICLQISENSEVLFSSWTGHRKYNLNPFKEVNGLSI